MTVELSSFLGHFLVFRKTASSSFLGGYIKYPRKLENYRKQEQRSEN